ncbi:MAG: DUF2934 domain-containing protein [Bryobacteraceae bacterium]
MPKKSTVEKEMTSAAAAAPARARRRPAASSKKHAAVAEQASAETKTAQSKRIAVKPSREEIAKLAYLYWEAGGRQCGSEEEDWLLAERELLSR